MPPDGEEDKIVEEGKTANRHVDQAVVVAPAETAAAMPEVTTAPDAIDIDPLDLPY